MVNEDILTSLKNAIEKGETLESAMQTLIVSGYNAREVQDTANYIGTGVVHIEKFSQDRMLTMPSQKKGLLDMFAKKPRPGNKQTTQQQPQQLPLLKPQNSQVPQSQLSQSNTNRMQTQSQDMSISSIPLPDGNFQPLINSQTTKPIPMQKPPQTLPQQLIKPSLPQNQQPPQQVQKPLQPLPMQLPLQPIPQQYSQPYPYPSQSHKMPQKQSYVKEVILLIMLLILAGILIITFRYRSEIIAFFSM